MSDVWKEKAEHWLNENLGYAPDDCVEELAGWMEKAEKWDLIQNYIIVELKTDPLSFFGKSETLDEFVKMKQKLEAVRTWHINQMTDPDLSNNIERTINELSETLGVEG